MDILTPLYREGGLLFLLDEYLSFAADKIRGRWGGDPRYHLDLFPIFRFFSYPFRFVSPEDWKVDCLLIFVSPKP